MLRYLSGLDVSLFYLINHLPHNLILNFIFGSITLVGYLGIIWFIIGFIIYFKEKKRDRRLLFSLALVELFSIFVEVSVKNMVGRLRPQFVLPGVIEPFDFYRSFSFPSGHAVIAFAGAFVLSRYKPKFKWLFYSIAVIISFSRIYLGKHFPSDILGGAVIGMGIGWFADKIKAKI